MKKLAFFVALMVGLSISPTVRRPEEEEGEVLELKDNMKRKSTSIITRLTTEFTIYFYAITKEGRCDIIKWDRIINLFKKDEKPNKNKHFFYQYKYDGKSESGKIDMF